MPTLEEIQKSHFQLMVVIVSRKDGEKASHALQERHCRFLISCLAHGTSGSEIMDLLGFGTIDKAVVVCLIPSFRNPELMAELTSELKLSKPGKGIAFTVPISGISVPILRFIDAINHESSAYAAHAGGAAHHGGEPDGGNRTVVDHASGGGRGEPDGGHSGGGERINGGQTDGGCTGGERGCDHNDGERAGGGGRGEPGGGHSGGSTDGEPDSGHAGGEPDGDWPRDWQRGMQRARERGGFAHGAEMLGKWRNAMENEVHRMSGNTSHDVIIAVVNKGNSQELVEAAKAAGARGGTVLNGRRTGMGGAANIFGMPIQAEKEIVAIIVSREIKHNVMKAINESFGFHNEAHGIVFSMPVDSVTGIEQ